MTAGLRLGAQGNMCGVLQSLTFFFCYLNAFGVYF